MIDDFDPLDADHVAKTLDAFKMVVSVEDPMVTIGGKEKPNPYAGTWGLSWEHGGMDLMGPDRPKEEARAAAALFGILWMAKTGMNPGTLRDMAVIYVNRVFDVARMHGNVRKFLSEIEALDAPDKIQELFAKAYELNGLQREGRFEEVNWILRDFKAGTRSTNAAVALLGYTSQAKDKLPARAALHKSAVAACLKEKGEADSIFKSLE